jgi:hypothetical protein
VRRGVEKIVASECRACDDTRRRGGEAATSGGYLPQLLQADADAGDMVNGPCSVT